jgi:hypothetical protein
VGTDVLTAFGRWGSKVKNGKNIKKSRKHPLQVSVGFSGFYAFRTTQKAFSQKVTSVISR